MPPNTIVSATHLTVDEWLAVLAVALPLIAKVFTDWASILEARRHEALGRIVGMAARQAADIARVIKTIPPGSDVTSVEKTLVAAAGAHLATEMQQSAASIGAKSDTLTGIVSSEVSKLLVTAPPQVPMAVAAPPVTTDGTPGPVVVVPVTPPSPMPPAGAPAVPSAEQVNPLCPPAALSSAPVPPPSPAAPPPPPPASSPPTPT
jgi:hypothetical protein